MLSSKYAVGQIWKYKNRPGEDDSRLSIHAIDRLTIQGRDQIVMYIQVDNIFSNKSGLGFVFTHDAIDRSAVELTDRIVAELNLVDSKLVLDAIRKGKLQCSVSTVAELVQSHENSLLEDARRTERTYAFIKDPYNPTLDELRWWAYDADAVEPDQDYESILARDEFYEDILRFAADPACPKQRFFLSCLYTIIHFYLRVISNEAHGDAAIEQMLNESQSVDNPDIQQWRARSMEMIKHPEKYDQSWVYGGPPEA